MPSPVPAEPTAYQRHIVAVGRRLRPKQGEPRRLDRVAVRDGVIVGGICKPLDA